MKDRMISFAVTQEQYEKLYMKVAKRIVDDKRHVTMSSYLRELVEADLTKDNNVSSPALDTDSKQKNNGEWKAFTIDD